MALENLEFKDQIGLIWRRTNRMGRRRRRREEEEEKRKKNRRRKRRDQVQKGMELWILYGLHGIVSFI